MGEVRPTDRVSSRLYSRAVDQAVEDNVEASAQPEIAPPPYRRIREVRLAVVMYGGVSLAIYMNGVAQELLHLVRSTAPASPKRRQGDRTREDLLVETEEDPDSIRPEEREDCGEPEEWALPVDSLEGTERVYRKLGQLLGREGALADLSDQDPILTRFVIDILTGSSAGGINAVFLAKALANNQSLKQLSSMWIEEGDISKLLNDPRSVEDLPGVSWVSPPASLLNGRRMYYKLLEAYDGMDALDEAGRSSPLRVSPLVDELDLYVTTTDLVGLRLPIRLTNRLIEERRYRNVFHFAYATRAATGEHRNDFHADRNPVLAFVSRCTSAFPFAFEPMVLRDIDSIVNRFGTREYRPYDTSSHGSAAPLWGKVFPDYASPAPGTLPYPVRPFADGGALDNKPFSYATEAVLRRPADLPIDRKLLFIEPDPGSPEPPDEPTERPDVIRNFLKQGVTLPRQETIREDLQRIADRNRLIQRVNRILFGVERDIGPSAITVERVSGEEWAGRDLKPDIERLGHAYGGYYRLKVQAVMDDIAALVVRVVGLEEGSDYELATRYILGAWRRQRYVHTANELGRDGAWGTLNAFLMDFDLAFRLRRLNYLQRKLDELYRLDEGADRLLALTGSSYRPQTPEELTAFRDEILCFKRITSSIYADLRKTGRDLRNRSEDNPIRTLAKATGITQEKLDAVLHLRTQDMRNKWGEQQFVDHVDALDALGKTLADRISAACEEASGRWKRALDRRAEEEGPARGAVTTFVRMAYDRFDQYDMVSFPMTYATGSSESDVIDVIRVSPEDTHARLAAPNLPSKVTGARYMHFGAFLDKLWRENDILWGRMDAADILIESLVPQPSDPDNERGRREREDTVEALRNEAQRAILSQQLKPEDRKSLVALMAEAMAKTSLKDRNVEHLRKLLESNGVQLKERLIPVLRLAISDEEALRSFYETDYEVNTQLSPRETMRTAGRGAHIAGQMFGGVAESRHLKPLGRLSTWLARLGQLLSAMTEAALPRGLPHMVTYHLLALLYVFEALAVVLGLLLNSAVVQRFGIYAFLLTFILNLLLLAFGDWLRGGRGYRVGVRLILLLVILAVFGLVVVGIRHLPEDIGLLGDNIKHIFGQVSGG